jgi:ADP-heptose:LPS heptosyltransferase
MASRFPVRALIAGLTLARLALAAPRRLLRRRRRPEAPRRILVAQQLLLGDAVMVGPLLAALRERYPQAALYMTCSRAFLPLYAGRPWGVTALAYEERAASTVVELLKAGPFDLVFIPAETRLSWLARAVGARWVVAFDGDRPDYKNWLVDELHPFSPTPEAWADMVATLCGHPSRSFCPGDWPMPEARPFAPPQRPYCVLHIGASSVLRRWEAANWCAVADDLIARGLHVAITCGANEGELLRAIDPEARHRHYPGTLDLVQLWHLLHDARLVVSLDTGIAHLARTAAVPLIVLFGPGSAELFGGGRFFAAAPERKVTIPNFPCRDENMVFRRHVVWAGHCGRTTRQCNDAKCMRAIAPTMVLGAIDELLGMRGRALSSCRNGTPLRTGLSAPRPKE